MALRMAYVTKHLHGYSAEYDLVHLHAMTYSWSCVYISVKDYVTYLPIPLLE